MILAWLCRFNMFLVIIQSQTRNGKHPYMILQISTVII